MSSSKRFLQPGVSPSNSQQTGKRKLTDWQVALDSACHRRIELSEERLNHLIKSCARVLRLSGQGGIIETSVMEEAIGSIDAYLKKDVMAMKYQYGFMVDACKERSREEAESSEGNILAKSDLVDNAISKLNSARWRCSEMQRIENLATTLRSHRTVPEIEEIIQGTQEKIDICEHKIKKLDRNLQWRVRRFNEILTATSNLQKEKNGFTR